MQLQGHDLGKAIIHKNGLDKKKTSRANTAVKEIRPCTETVMVRPSVKQGTNDRRKTYSHRLTSLTVASDESNLFRVIRQEKRKFEEWGKLIQVRRMPKYVEYGTLH